MYIYAVCGRKFDRFPAKYTVYAPYIYGSGHIFIPGISPVGQALLEGRHEMESNGDGRHGGSFIPGMSPVGQALLEEGMRWRAMEMEGKGEKSVYVPGKLPTVVYLLFRCRDYMCTTDRTCLSKIA